MIRTFTSRAGRALGIDYNIIEAFDAPWKSFEGSVGQYWGIFDADRHLKFYLTGPLEQRSYGRTAILAVLLGFAFCLPMLGMRGSPLRRRLRWVAAACGVGAWVALVVDHWGSHYVTGGNYVTAVMSLLLLGPLVIVILYRFEELTAIVFGGRLSAWWNCAPAPCRRASRRSPFISRPIASRGDVEADAGCRRAARMAESGMRRCAEQHARSAMVEPVRAHCELLGERFKFLNIEKMAGFRLAPCGSRWNTRLPDAEIIGVIDADYVVHADWLKDLVPCSRDPTVGLVQAPQDHRDGYLSPMHEAMNARICRFLRYRHGHSATRTTPSSSTAPCALSAARHDGGRPPGPPTRSARTLISA